MTTINEKKKRFDSEIDQNKDISIINLLEYIIEKAVLNRVSDIHIDPITSGVKVRFRIDGVLETEKILPKTIHGEIISRIKVLSKLRTDEHQATQDGRFRYIFTETNQYVDIRVSIVPTYHGENCVMRLLSDKSENYTLKDLGFEEEDRKKILEAIKKPHGMILSTGPTGSGKTTTLYTLIKMLNSSEISIITIEDPIEYAVNDIKQIQVNQNVGLSFANGLRSILRQDPNIIMVGEIRDKETASIAVNTALTGHLLLSTLHTNDASTTIPRLLDMGIEEYLVASTISIAIGQRLVRKICENCKEEVEMTDTIKKSLNSLGSSQIIKNLKKIYKGKGCENCFQSGYRGRICINEILVTDEKIKEAILRKAPASEIKKIAVSLGMTDMLEDGLKKVMDGKTTLEEILRVIHE